MSLNYNQLMDYINNNKSIEDQYGGAEGWINQQAFQDHPNLNPLMGMTNASSTAYKTYDIPGVGAVQYDPSKGTIDQFADGYYSPGSNGQQFTEYSPTGNSAQTSKSGSSWLDPIANQLDWVVPALMVAGAGAGAAGWTADGAAGAGAAGGSTALPAGGMTSTGTLGAGGDAALGSGMYGTGVGDIGSAMGTSGGYGAMGSGFAGVPASDLSFAGSATGSLGADQGANEWAKLLQQNDAAPGSFYNAPASSGFNDLINKYGTKLGKSALQNIFSDMLKSGQTTPQGAASGGFGSLPMQQPLNYATGSGPLQQVSLARPFGFNDVTTHTQNTVQPYDPTYNG